MNAAVQPSVVLVEDDLRLSEVMRSFLQSNGFRVSVENRGDHVLERVRIESPDVLVLDLGLPGKDGLSVCREVRASFSLPILILTARDNDIDHVVGLELGADDYVIKPVEPRVLVARIQALLRRSRTPTSIESRTLKFGQLIINGAARSVTLEDRPIPLSSSEFDLLMFLATHAGEPQSREILYQHLHKREYNGMDRALDVRISHLRRKLGDTGAPEKIKTVWGQGYLFVPDAW